MVEARAPKQRRSGHLKSAERRGTQFYSRLSRHAADTRAKGGERPVATLSPRALDGAG